jgi:hypothetical protein
MLDTLPQGHAGINRRAKFVRPARYRTDRSFGEQSFANIRNDFRYKGWRDHNVPCAAMDWAADTLQWGGWHSTNKCTQGRSRQTYVDVWLRKGVARKTQDKRIFVSLWRRFRSMRGFRGFSTVIHTGPSCIHRMEPISIRTEGTHGFACR